MWNAIKKSPGTAVIVVAVIVGVIVTSLIFPERSQLIATLGVLSLVSIITFRIHIVAGAVVTVLILVGVGFWIPAFVQEYNRAEDPNGTFASFFAKAKKQTEKASETYQPGATSQASLLTGVMTVDAKLSQNFDNFIVRTGSTITTDQLTLDSTQVDSLMYAAGKIKENQLVFSSILSRGGVNESPYKKQFKDVKVDLTDPDGYIFVVHQGEQAYLKVVRADYALMTVHYRNNNGSILGGPEGVPYRSNEQGKVDDNPNENFVAPNLAHYAAMYKKDGKWLYLNREPALIQNRGSEPMEIVVTVNDVQGTYGTNTGELVISYDVSPIPVDFVSAD